VHETDFVENSPQRRCQRPWLANASGLRWCSEPIATLHRTFRRVLFEDPAWASRWKDLLLNGDDQMAVARALKESSHCDRTRRVLQGLLCARDN
jgi:hypothetical protein